LSPQKNHFKPEDIKELRRERCIEHLILVGRWHYKYSKAQYLYIGLRQYFEYVIYSTSLPSASPRCNKEAEVDLTWK